MGKTTIRQPQGKNSADSPPDALPDGEFEESGKLASELKIERPFSLPEILLNQDE
jgi:hypothetical protein